MEKIKNEKRISKAICLTLAIILWLYVSVYENPTMTKTAYDIPVKVSDEQTERLRNNNYSVYSVSQNTVDVKVTSQRLNLSKLTDETLTAYINIDFSKIKGSGKYSFPIRISCNENINASYFPEEENIEIVIESVKSESFNINVDIDNKYVAYDTYATEENNVLISAPESIFNQIATVKTETITIDKEIEKATKSILLYDKDGNIIDNDRISISPKKIDITFSYLDSKTVPVALKTSDGKEYTLPSESDIQIYGKSDVIEKIYRIYTTEVNVSEYIENSEIDVAIELPEGINVAKENKEITIKLLPAYFN